MLKRILFLTQRYTKVNTLYLAKNGTWLVSGNIISAISVLVLAIFLANLLPKEVYGNYKFILSIAGLIGAFSLTGMGASLNQSIARGFEGALHTATIVTLKWSLMSSLIAFCMAFYYLINGNGSLAISLIIVGLLSPISQSAGLYSGFLYGKKKFKEPTRYGVIKTLISSVVLIVSVVFFQNATIMILTILLTQTLLSVFFYRLTVNKYKPSASGGEDPQMVNFAKHLSLINLFGIISSNLDNVVVFHLLGASSLAVYAFATALPAQLGGVLKNMRTLALPRFSEQSFESVRATMLSKVLLTFIFSSCLVLLYILVAPLIYNLFFPQYTDSIIYTQLFALAIIPSTTAMLPSTFLESHKKKTSLYIQKISSSVLQVILFLILGKLYGIYGIIISIICAKTLTVIMLTYFSLKD